MALMFPNGDIISSVLFCFFRLRGTTAVNRALSESGFGPGLSILKPTARPRPARSVCNSFLGDQPRPVAGYVKRRNVEFDLMADTLRSGVRTF